MREQVKVFTFVSGHGETVVEPKHEDHINQWLSSAKGRFCEYHPIGERTSGGGHHVTVCVWYVLEE